MHWPLTDRLFSLDRPAVMGIVNVTPDSFSDGGHFATTEAAVSHALRLVDDGADLLDIGGESTRPNAAFVPEAEEIRRVLPVVKALVNRVAVPLSIDTSKAEVARRCLAAGAHIVNDVTALTGDPRMMEVCAASKAGIVLMHMRGTPATMHIDPRYDDVVGEIGRYLEERLHALTSQGIAADRVVLDPGIGFGKTLEHNLEILARIPELRRMGRPICLGVSRKGFIGTITGRPRNDRAFGSVAAVGPAVWQGAAHILRVHDVAATRDAVLMWSALAPHSPSPREGDP